MSANHDAELLVDWVGHARMVCACGWDSGQSVNVQDVQRAHAEHVREQWGGDDW